MVQADRFMRMLRSIHAHNLLFPFSFFIFDTIKKKIPERISYDFIAITCQSSA